MGLSSSLQIGRSGLLAGQTGIEVTGNNLSNITTRGHHRQSVTLVPSRSQEIQRGVFLGQGVEVQQVVRHVNEALESRLRNGIADQSYSATRQTLLSQIEAVQNELSDIDLSTQLSEFFNAFSEMALSPEDNAARTVVIQQGQTLASFARNLRSDLTAQLRQLDDTLNEAAIAADDLLTQIAQVNQEIVQTERGAGGAHGLRDERDMLLGELSQFLDISTVEHTNGSVDVFVGSLPVVLNNNNRGIELRQETVNGQPQIDVVIKDNNSELQMTSGRLAALVDGGGNDINNAINVLDNFVSELIFQVNRVHSQGQALEGFSSVTGTSVIADTTVPLNDPAAALDFLPTHGSFQIHVTQTSTGQRTSATINIDLDAIAVPADTTLNSLVASINTVTGVTATITPDGRLQIASNGSDLAISFSDDSSGVLAALGINTFFSGHNAGDIDVNPIVQQNPGMVSAATGHVPGSNGTALGIAGLRDQAIPTLNGLSLIETWNRHVQDYAVRAGQAQQRLEADTIVRENLESQQQAVSGVNADEEAINLLVFQRAYQGSARFISVVDELLQTLLSLV